MSYFLVGEAPNPAAIGKPELVLRPDDELKTRATANELCKLAAWTPEQFMAVFGWRRTLWPDARQITGFEHIGRQSAVAIMREAAEVEADGILILGARAAGCFGLRSSQPLTWCGVGTRPAAVIPHPSGNTRYWSDHEHVWKARHFFGEMLKRAGVGAA